MAVFINEFHYDNVGTDTFEGVEIAGPAGTNLSGYSLAFYAYNPTFGDGDFIGSIGLGSMIPNQQNGFGTLGFGIGGIPNDPGAIALVDDRGQVLQFLSYERTFAAFDGPAAGLSATNIGVFESSSLHSSG